MSAGTPYDTLAPSFEVRIYRDDWLLVRAFCENWEEAMAIASQGSDLDPAYVLVDDGSPTQGPGDVFALEETRGHDDEHEPLASTSIPGIGTE